jgi:hypothetical protein
LIAPATVLPWCKKVEALTLCFITLDVLEPRVYDPSFMSNAFEGAEELAPALADQAVLLTARALRELAWRLIVVVVVTLR